LWLKVNILCYSYGEKEIPVSTIALSASKPGIILICLNILFEEIDPPPGCVRIIGTAAVYDGA